MLCELNINEQTLYANLKGLKKWEEIKYLNFKVTRFKEGRKVTFKQTYWWVE